MGKYVYFQGRLKYFKRIISSKVFSYLEIKSLWTKSISKLCYAMALKKFSSSKKPKSHPHKALRMCYL